ncbi:MAG: hypothetical protein V1898_04530 [Patescibacteria group bacterium]
MSEQRYFNRDSQANDYSGDQLADMQSKAREGKQLVIQSPELAGYIDHIDFELLNNVIRELLERYGVKDFSRLNLNADKIYQENKALGRYNFEADIVAVNISAIKSLELTESAKKIVVLRSIIHEYLHSLSYQVIHRYDGSYKYVRARVGLGGYETDESKNMMVSLEEGLNEILTKQILSEYVLAAGDVRTAEYHKIDEEEINKSESLSAYDLDVRIVNRLIIFIARESGVSEKTVFQAMVKEKLFGENLLGIWRKIFIDLLGLEHGESLYRVLVIASSSYYGSRDDLEKKLKRLAKLPREKVGFFTRAIEFVLNALEL